MKKIASFFAVATFALVGTSLAQQVPTSTTGADDVSFGSVLNRPKPKSSAAPAVDNGGKKMVGEAMVATDEKGAKAATNFPAGTTTVYLVTKNVSGAKGDKVTAEWYVDDAGKAMPKGKRFYNSAIELPNTSTYNPNFHATGPGSKAFPPGKYHVDVLIGKEKFKTVKFVVQ